jgi:hypothetical protein
LVDNVKRFITIIKASVRLKGLKAKLMITDAADEKDITRFITHNKVYNIPSITLNQLFQRIKDHTEFFFTNRRNIVVKICDKRRRGTRERERERESARSEKIKWTSGEEQEHLRRDSFPDGPHPGGRWIVATPSSKL